MAHELVEIFQSRKEILVENKIGDDEFVVFHLHLLLLPLLLDSRRRRDGLDLRGIQFVDLLLLGRRGELLPDGAGQGIPPRGLAVAVLRSVGDYEHPWVRTALLHLLPRQATFRAATSVVAPAFAHKINIIISLVVREVFEARLHRYYIR